MQTSPEETKIKPEELMKGKEEQARVKKEFCSGYVVFERRERYYLGEVSEQVLVKTVTWRLDTILLLNNGAGASGEQCLSAVGYVQALPKPSSEKPRGSKENSYWHTHVHCGSYMSSSSL